MQIRRFFPTNKRADSMQVGTYWEYHPNKHPKTPFYPTHHSKSNIEESSYELFGQEYHVSDNVDRNIIENTRHNFRNDIEVLHGG